MGHVARLPCTCADRSPVAGRPGHGLRALVKQEPQRFNMAVTSGGAGFFGGRNAAAPSLGRA
ncbi:hypothetical protein roselon_03300 [Roseibacterium elongatum DSM 19469]|uniref:Uncharacterized protein n=1 Tax=Roseicyclus elongatus DSM 19469 TaxID=1294273 RepID=W8RW72_9RHOB|nr:hypothetical protein roselon_03300 [Roseibacterium elongatum DSM 19469]